MTTMNLYAAYAATGGGGKEKSPIFLQRKYRIYSIAKTATRGKPLLPSLFYFKSIPLSLIVIN